MSRGCASWSPAVVLVVDSGTFAAHSLRGEFDEKRTIAGSMHRTGAVTALALGVASGAGAAPAKAPSQAKST